MNKRKLLPPSQTFIAISIEHKNSGDLFYYYWFTVADTYDASKLGELNITQWAITNGITLMALATNGTYIRTYEVERFVMWYNSHIIETPQESK